MFVDKLFFQDHLHSNDDLSQDDQKVSCSKKSVKTFKECRFQMCTFLAAHALRTRHLTCDDVTEFVRMVVTLAEEVGEPYDNQAQDGGEDANPLAGCQASAQERNREQTGEDDDGSTQHLEAGGTSHVES